MEKSIILKYWITSHVGHSLSLPATIPPAVGEGGGVKDSLYSTTIFSVKGH